MAALHNGEASAAQTAGQPLTNGQKESSPVALQTEAYKNGDARMHPPESTENQIWGFIRENWRWGIGLLIAGGFIAVPATTWQLNASVAKLDSEIRILDATVTTKLEEQDKRITAIQADMRQMYGAMLNIDRKIDAALDHRVAQTPAPLPASPPHKQTTPKKPFKAKPQAKRGWLS